MKSAFSLMFAWSLICYHLVGAAETTASGTSSIKWLTNYEEAMTLAKEQSKPLLLFFTGTGWCPYCTKLEQEVFHTQEFAQSSGGQFIFMILDFPQDKYAMNPQIVAQNRQLQRKFDVRSFPTVILYDAQQQRQIGITGYRPGGPKQYVNHLNGIMQDYSMYNQKIQKMEQQKLSGAELKQLYDKAKEFDLQNDLSLIIKSGIQSDLKNFFLLEQYRLYAEEGLVHGKEATTLRNQLLALDPNNQKKFHYEVAVIDFEAYSEEKERYSATEAVAPLIAYVEKYGTQDKDNLWRLQMIISQVFLDQHQLKQALKFAESAYYSAPASIRPEISVVIKNIQSQIKN